MEYTFSERLLNAIYRRYHWWKSSNLVYQRYQQKRIYNRFPSLTYSQQQFKEITSFLEPHYNQYVNEVSTPQMALSLKAAVFMFILCDVIKPKRVLDLGSGFSSFVLRTYAVTHREVKVWSIDDNHEWLDRTKAYLVEHELSTERLMLWDEFYQSLTIDPFDFVVHDMGSMIFRQQVLSEVIKMVQSGQGLIFLDDVHKPLYARYVRHCLLDSSSLYFDLILDTLDQYQRYCGLIVM